MKCAFLVTISGLFGLQLCADSLKTTTHEELSADKKQWIKRTVTFRGDNKILSYVETKNAGANSQIVVTETVFYGDDQILIQHYLGGEGKEPVLTARTFWGHDKIILAEQDNNHDGVCDIIVIRGRWSSLYEAFSRRSNGRLVPMTDAKLKELKVLSGDVRSFFDDVSSDGAKEPKKTN